LRGKRRFLQGEEPGWAAAGARSVTVGTAGAVPVQLELPPMAFEYYLICLA
jgi:hypothetical protein